MAKEIAGRRKGERMGSSVTAEKLERSRKIIRHDERMEFVLEGLRDFVDNLNQQKTSFGFDDKQVQSIKFDGVEVGYRLIDRTVAMTRQVFIKTPDYKLSEIPPEEMKPIMAAVFQVFIIPGAGSPNIKIINTDCVMLEQSFVPMLLVNQNPNLVSKIGGVNLDEKGKIIH